ncbi:MAG TPA: DUF3108 domain-containing protein [Pseudomonadales bacterium]
MNRPLTGVGVAAALALLAIAGLHAAPPDPMPVPEPERTVSLRYRAYLAGTPVGRATVRLAVAADGYRIEGEAASEGWMEGVTRWRNRFQAEGTLTEAAPLLREFSYVETDRGKERRVSVRDRILQVMKNGKHREPRPAPDGADVLSALFVQPSCLPERLVHTGRHLYRLTRLAAGDGVCRYRVIDDDDEAFEVAVDLIRHAGLTVPGRITFHGWVSGSIELAGGDS